MKRKPYGTHQIAKICHVTPPTIGRWMMEGQLPFFKTVGGHRRVWDNDLIAFLKKHQLPIPEELLTFSSPRVLIVDDESSIRKFIIKIVKDISPQAEIFQAVDGFDAGHKIATLLPTVIVLDIRLPGIDGLKVCQTVRSDPKTKKAKILAISGYNHQESKVQALRNGADAFLGKPFSEDEIIKKLKYFLN